MGKSWKNVLCACVLILTAGCVCRDGGSKGASPEAKKEAKTPSLQKNFFLPDKIYAVPGVECNVYFRNIFFAVNHGNFVFDADCPAGRQEKNRWVFTPSSSDENKRFPLTVRVYDANGLVARGSTTVFVSPADAGKGKKVSILVVGDSLTNATEYPRQLLALCRKSSAPVLTMIGSHAGNGKTPEKGGVAHEGYGGWAWGTFLTQYVTDPADRQYKTYRRASKFLVYRDGKKVFSLADYVKKYNEGRMPDVITFQLGVNDVFGAKEENLPKRIRSILANADKLIACFRKEAPKALIGVGFVTGGADQDAFGNNYKCGQTAFGYYRNHFRLNQAMAKHFAACGDKKLFMIPSHVNLDTENNFPVTKTCLNAENRKEVFLQSNGVHPAVSGYRQMGDSFYAWLKYLLASGAFSPEKK